MDWIVNNYKVTEEFLYLYVFTYLYLKFLSKNDNGQHLKKSSCNNYQMFDIFYELSLN